MSLPTSLLAYQDCMDIYEKAADTEKGVRVPVKDQNAAIHLRMRMQQCRTLHRKENAMIYQPGEPLYGKSEYDKFTCRIRTNGTQFWLYVEANTIDLGVVESIDEIEGEPPPIFAPVYEPSAEVMLGLPEVFSRRKI